MSPEIMYTVNIQNLLLNEYYFTKKYIFLFCFDILSKKMCTFASYIELIIHRIWNQR